MSLTTRLLLNKHTLGDQFRVADYAENWDLLDGTPGILVCADAAARATASASFGTNQAGRFAIDLDTGLTYRWDGTQWLRSFGKGLLGSGERTTDFATTSSSYVVATSVSAVVPANPRPLLIVVEGPGAASTVGLTEVAVFRDATEIQAWPEKGGNSASAAAYPTPISMTLKDAPVAGTYTYSIQCRVTGYGGTSTLKAAATTPLAIHVVEI